MKFSPASLTIPVILLTVSVMGGCVVQQLPAPVSDGSRDAVSSTTPSLEEPYTPPPLASDSQQPREVSAREVSVAQPEPQPVPVNSQGTYVAETKSPSSYVPSYAPVDITAKQHTVVRGDTVFNIAKRYHIAQEDLRNWNHLTADTISVGQILYVKKPSKTTSSTAISPSVRKPTSSAETVSPGGSDTVPSSTSSVNKGKVSNASSNVLKKAGGISWIKPASGQMVKPFSLNSKGVEIAGKLGSPVVAAADGKVIYSSTLSGYGNLIIIQHTGEYLTAYGNNQNNLVKEGAVVKQGQQIATMGKSETNKVQLHFELRKNGQAVDPTTYVPIN
ncbi:MAG: peptidoglycan DD-metalloendopeptidase family protein [Neisseriaceae bacterium]